MIVAERRGGGLPWPTTRGGTCWRPRAPSCPFSLSPSHCSNLPPPPPPLVPPPANSHAPPAVPLGADLRAGTGRECVWSPLVGVVVVVAVGGCGGCRPHDGRRRGRKRSRPHPLLPPPRVAACPPRATHPPGRHAVLASAGRRPARLPLPPPPPLLPPPPSKHTPAPPPFLRCAAHRWPLMTHTPPPPPAPTHPPRRLPGGARASRRFRGDARPRPRGGERPPPPRGVAGRHGRVAAVRPRALPRVGPSYFWGVLPCGDPPLRPPCPPPGPTYPPPRFPRFSSSRVCLPRHRPAAALSAPCHRHAEPHRHSFVACPLDGAPNTPLYAYECAVHTTCIRIGRQRRVGGGEGQHPPPTVLYCAFIQGPSHPNWGNRAGARRRRRAQRRPPLRVPRSGNCAVAVAARTPPPAPLADDLRNSEGRGRGWVPPSALSPHPSLSHPPLMSESTSSTTVPRPPVACWGGHAAFRCGLGGGRERTAGEGVTSGRTATAAEAAP